MPGEAVGLVGESGSGKSTLARAALGLTPAKIARIEAGRIRIAGRDVTHFSEDEWAAMRGNPVAIVFQDPLSYLNPVMRVGRQIAESVARHTPRLADWAAREGAARARQAARRPASRPIRTSCPAACASACCWRSPLPADPSC